jgi:hypothetical protein
MPSPHRSPAPLAPTARKLTPVPPARRLTPVPPPLPGRPPARAAAPTAPALAVARDELEDSVDEAFEQVVVRSGQTEGPLPAASATTAADLAALHGTYLELAVEYCAPVRNVMLEVRWGEPPMRWLEHVRSALVSLRAMAEQVELGALAAALDRFNAAVDSALGSGEGLLSGTRRDELLAAYAPLCAALPRAFELDGERDRREPIILRAVLLLVPELSPLVVEKLFSAGLIRLEVLARARPEEIAVVTGLEPALAERVLERVRAERALAAGEVGQERGHVAGHTAQLVDEHRALEAAAAGWSAQSQGEKRRWRRQRQQSWLRVRISLARLGEVDRLERMERLPFARRIEGLEGFLGAAHRPSIIEGGARAAATSEVTGGRAHG